MAEGRTKCHQPAALLSEKTVEDNVRRIFDKLGLTHSTEVNRRVHAVRAILA